MATELANMYYIKAVDHYPFDLETTMENLNYALAYDEGHAGACYLMGKLQSEHLKDDRLAIEYLEQAFASDPSHFESCVELAFIYVRHRAYLKAEKLLKYAYGISGADRARVYYLKALIYEYQRNYDAALYYYDLAKVEAFNNEFLFMLDAQIERVQQKQRLVSRTINEDADTDLTFDSPRLVYSQMA